MNKLISMVDFVDEIDNTLVNPKSNREHELKKLKAYEDIQRYKDFLNTPLNLSMFVPCVKVGDEWEVLKRPDFRDYQDDDCVTDWNLYNKDEDEFMQAKENVLFEGDFGFDENPNKELEVFEVLFSVYKTVESLIDFGDVTLTQQGTFKSGLK